MESGLALFSLVQFGIAVLTGLVLVFGWLRPKVLRWRAALAAKAAAASASVAASTLPEPALDPAKAE